MGKFRRVDVSTGWQNRKIRALQKALEEQRAAKRLPGTEVAAGTNFFVRGILSVVGLFDLTGTMSMKSVAGDELVRMGDQTFGDRGVSITRETGVVAFEMRQKDATVEQTWSLRDGSGAEVVADGPFVGGLARPYLAMPFQPYAAASGTAYTCGPYGVERTHASTTWTTVFIHDGKKQNPYLDLKVAAKCSDGSTSGEVRVVDRATGTILPGWFATAWTGAIPTSTTAFITLDPTPNETSLFQTFAHAAQMGLDIQLRRTAGTGTITLAVIESIGG